MSITKNLYDALTPLRLYALGSDSLIDRELTVYGEALSQVERQLQEIVAQIFVQTATDRDLARHEKLVGLVGREEAPLQTRRDLVLYRLGVADQDYTVGGITGSIRTAGMVAQLDEDAARERVTVRCSQLLDQTVNLDWLKENLVAMLPAHLEMELDIGLMTWDMFDAGPVTWDKWDATGMTWTEFDVNGHYALLSIKE